MLGHANCAPAQEVTKTIFSSSGGDGCGRYQQRGAGMSENRAELSRRAKGFWLGDKDSNLDMQIQSLLSYR
jgi:hypothetical protein